MSALWCSQKSSTCSTTSLETLFPGLLPQRCRHQRIEIDPGTRAASLPLVFLPRFRFSLSARPPFADRRTATMQAAPCRLLLSYTVHREANARAAGRHSRWVPREARVTTSLARPACEAAKLTPHRFWLLQARASQRSVAAALPAARRLLRGGQPAAGQGGPCNRKGPCPTQRICTQPAQAGNPAHRKQPSPLD